MVGIKAIREHYTQRMPDEDGSYTIEATIALPIIILLTFVVMQFAWVLLACNSVESAAVQALSSPELAALGTCTQEELSDNVKTLILQNSVGVNANSLEVSNVVYSRNTTRTDAPLTDSAGTAGVFDTMSRADTIYTVSAKVKYTIPMFVPLGPAGTVEKTIGAEQHSGGYVEVAQG